MQVDIQNLVERMRSVAVADREVIREELGRERAEDLAEGLVRLPLEEGLELLRNLDPNLASEILTELPTETTRQFLAELPDSTLAHYLDILPMDDAVDLREDLGEERFDALLQVIPRDHARRIRRLLAYPESSVGRVMTEAFFEVFPEMTMDAILADIRRSPEDKYEMVNDLYVIDEDRHLIGIMSLRKAIRARPNATAREVMRTDTITCQAEGDAEEAARAMSRYGFYALPVLDKRARMVGIFTGDDAQSLLTEEDTEDILRMGGMTGTAEAYLSLSPIQLARRRIVWLAALFVAETFTGSVLRYYGQADGGDLKLSPLTYFIPLLIGAGGNSGSQTTTMVTRALAVGEIKTGDWATILLREFTASMMVGVGLGFLAFLNARYRWGSSMEVALSVGLALPAIIVWASSVGGLLPLAAKRIGIDPAVMSAPFISTLVDATGLVIYFEIARRIIQG